MESEEQINSIRESLKKIWGYSKSFKAAPDFQYEIISIRRNLRKLELSQITKPNDTSN